MTLRPLVLGLPLLAVVGCVAAAGEPEDGSLGTAPQAIMGGYDDAKDTDVVDVIWYPPSSNSYSECSGSLLAPNLVLTARHCVAHIDNDPNGIDCSASTFTAPDPPSSFHVSTVATLVLPFVPTQFHDVREILTLTNAGVCGNDMALLVLADEIQPPTATPLLPRVDVALKAGEGYSAVGFGNINDTQGAGQRRRLDKLHVNCVAGGCEQPQYLSPAHEWLGDHGVCEGDSGGPALDLQGRVVGVTSRGAAGCIDPVYGYVFSWADWIKQGASHAAEVGGYTAPPWASGWPTDPIYNFPVGTEAGNPPTCASGLSLSDSEGTYCTRLCEAAAPCPSGFTCTVVGGEHVCQQNPPPAASSSGGPTSTRAGCGMANDDPTKPVPWRTGAAITAAGLALLRRRRRR